jgi:hypothetical protein
MPMSDGELALYRNNHIPRYVKILDCFARIAQQEFELAQWIVA